MKRIIFAVVASMFCFSTFAQTVDYSVVHVPEESGLDFTMMTSDNDYVCMPLVKRTRSGVDWLTNKIIDVSPSGDKLAFLSFRNGTSNIFLKDILKKGSAMQRTNRKSVLDFSYSVDGKLITFSETVADKNVIFQTDASNGFVCRQITTGNKDYSPVYTADGSTILFARQEAKSVSIWSYDLNGNFLASYTSGMNPCVMGTDNTIICVRINGYGKGEIWKVNLMTGVEECILSDPEKSFSTPSLSPDGQWILCVGSTPIVAGKMVYWNTDIYVCRTDGTHLSQLTYHAADELSPEWSHDGKFIYFISQRGSATATANIWRMNFVVY